MNVIVPVAGRGTRMRPLTYARPKPLLHVGGGTLLDHALAPLRAIHVREWIFVVGHLGSQIEDHVRARSDLGAAFVHQAEPRGQADAVARARAWLEGPILVLFPDMVFDVDLDGLGADSDGTIFAREVADPRRFGVVITDDRGLAARFVEKPTAPVSRRAVVGLYHVADGAWLRDALEWTLSSGPPDLGEHYLAEALQRMIDEGARFAVRPARRWLDCGTLGDLRAANRTLLDQTSHRVRRESIRDTEIRPPVHIAPGARVVGGTLGPGCYVGPGSVVTDSLLGPNVSLEGDARLDGARVSDAVIHRGARIRRARVRESVLGENATVSGIDVRAVLGDDCVVEHHTDAALDGGAARSAR